MMGRDAAKAQALAEQVGAVPAAGSFHGRPLDVFIAGDDAQAKARIGALIESLGLRAMDIGPLTMARTLEHACLLSLGLLAHAIKAGHTVEVIVHDPVQAQAFADKPGVGASTGTYGTAPTGDIVILAVPYSGAAPVVADFGDALKGKVIIDITNPVAPDLSGLVAPSGSSGAQETARSLPVGAHVVNEHPLRPRPRQGKTARRVHGGRRCGSVTLLESPGLRPLDVCALHMAQTLESVGLLMIGLARNGTGTFDIALQVDIGSTR